jgi:hypothetical protein
MTPEQKAAKAAYAKAYRAANREKLRAYSAMSYRRTREHQLADRKERYKQNKEKIRAQTEAYRKNNPIKVRDARHKIQGIPSPTRPEPVTCECCMKPKGGRTLNVDHCHVSGEFRGWLCFSCNVGLGKFGDSIVGLMNAVRYLQRAAEQRGE